MRKDLEQRGTQSMSPCSWSPTQTVSPTRSTHLWAMARRVKPSTGRRAKQLPRSRRSLTHSRGGKRRSSLLGGVQSWYTLRRTSSSKDRTSFSSASESPCLWKGGTDVTSSMASCPSPRGSPWRSAFGQCPPLADTHTWVQLYPSSKTFPGLSFFPTPTEP